MQPNPLIYCFFEEEEEQQNPVISHPGEDMGVSDLMQDVSVLSVLIRGHCDHA